MIKTLIHTTTSLEANPVIDFFELEKLEVSDYKVYSNDEILLIESGVSKEQIFESLLYVVENYEISKAFDFSTAYSCETSVAVGTLFCTNKLIYGINFATSTTLNRDFEEDEVAQTLLVDKQEKYFKEFFKEQKDEIDTFTFKVVSKYYADEDLAKDRVYSLMFNACKKIQRYI